MTDLTLRDIEGAERLLGIAYTEAEREQMLGNLAGQIAAAESRRALDFPNSLPPATVFDPRLPGVEAPEGPVLATPSGRDPGPLPEADEDIAFAPVRALSHWIRTGALSSRRLTEIYLARIERLQPTLECFVTVTADFARAEADAADAAQARGEWKGPLHGIPYGLKDLFDTAGIPTTWGAEPFADRIPDTDAEIVTRLRAAGAVLLGKTAVGALAYGDIWQGGVCRNPWNLEEGSSGSSAGSGAAVAAGLVGFGIGTETLGSITSPSARCGCTGLRPTFGRVPRTGGMALCYSLDKVGPMCREAEDCALVFAALTGPDGRDRSCIGAGFAFDGTAALPPVRLGYMPKLFDETGSAVDRAALEAALRLPGVTPVELELPDLPYGALTNILFAEAAATFERLTLDGLDDRLTRQDDGAWPNTFRKARFLSAVDHVQADRLRYRVMEVFDGIFRDVDALIGPFGLDAMLIATNFTGHPSMLIPAGLESLATRPRLSLAGGKLDEGAGAADAPRREVPRGITLWTGLWREDLLVRLGMALEAELGMLGRRPPV